MIYNCSYCSRPFVPKRTDSLYCSHACRQFAYVLRKSYSTQYPAVKEIQITGDSERFLPALDEVLANRKQIAVRTDTENGISVTTDNRTNEQVSLKLSVSTDEDEQRQTVTNESTTSALPEDRNSDSEGTNIQDKIRFSVSAPEIPVMTVESKKEIPLNSLAEETGEEMPYKFYESIFVSQLNNLYEERSHAYTLSLFIEGKDPAGLWLSIRYRCLVDVLLTFNELKRIELNDLKEICNAFTLVIKSKYFKYVDSAYPYSDEIIIFRTLLWKICNSARQEQFKFILSKEQKQKLLVTRFELSEFIPKIKYKDMSFKANLGASD